jgi:hypothetical protein
MSRAAETILAGACGMAHDVVKIACAQAVPPAAPLLFSNGDGSRQRVVIQV